MFGVKLEWWKIIGLLTLLWKISLVVQKLMRDEGNVPPVRVEKGLGRAWNGDGTFSIMNRKNVSFTLSPETCGESTHWMVLMILTMPQNKNFRDNWRQNLKSRSGVKLIFLNSNTKTKSDQEKLEAEHAEYRDIVQCSQDDGHRWLGYKILCGLTWSQHHCPSVSHVVQSDDNIELYLDTMFQDLRHTPDPEIEDVISCPSVTLPSTVIRSSTPAIMGGWSYTKEEYPKDTLPLYCNGWMTRYSPKVAGELVQVGLELYSETGAAHGDFLVSGILRERLPHVRIEMMGGWWHRMFLGCRRLNEIKATFFNYLVKSKTSSRGHIHYVGSVTNLHVWKYYLCLHLESHLMNAEKFIPQLIPSAAWNICSR